MKVPLRENGIYLGGGALLAVLLVALAESVTVRMAEEPVTVAISQLKTVPATPLQTEGGADGGEAEAFDLGRSPAHEAIMADPELKAHPELLLEKLKGLRNTEGDSPALLNDTGVAALRAKRPKEAASFFRQAISLQDNYARGWYNLGIALARADYHSDAIAAYRAALERNPGYQEAALNLGGLLRADGDLEGARQEFARAAEISSAETRAKALLLEGEVLNRLERYEESADVLRRSTEYNPRDPEAWLLLGKALLRSPDSEKAALAAIDNALALTRDPDMYLDLARDLGQQLKTQLAIDYLHKALKLDPASRKLRRQMAGLFMEEGDHRSAATQYEWLVNNTADPAEQATFRAELALIQEDFTEAAAQLRIAIKSNSDDLDTHLRLGFILRKAGREEEALREYEDVLSDNPANETALVGAAGSALGLGDVERAKRLIERALETDPDDPDIWFMRGRLLESADAPSEAAAAFRKVLEYKPNYRSAAINLAILERRLGNPRVAIQLYESLLKKHPRYTLARYNMAVVLAAMGQDEEAAAEYEAVIAQDPENDKARLNLAVIRRGRGELKAAEELLRDALARDPGNTSARFNLTLLLGDLAREKEQEVELQRITRVDPSFAKAWRSLGRLQEARGELTSAAESYLHAFKVEPAETRPLVEQLIAKTQEPQKAAAAATVYSRLIAALNANPTKPNEDRPTNKTGEASDNGPQDFRHELEMTYNQEGKKP